MKRKGATKGVQLLMDVDLYQQMIAECKRLGQSQRVFIERAIAAALKKDPS